MKLNKKELSLIVDVSRISDDFIFDTSKISTDTRTINPDNYFYAIKGDNFDGNKFVLDAINKGVKVILAEKFPVSSSRDTIFFEVLDDKKNLYDLSKIVLKKSSAIKIAITGSNGKTTTKEILAALLAVKLKTHKTEGNFNNNIGLPLSIFKLRDYHRSIVLEMGMSAIGEIDYLASIVEPHFSIITNIGRAHLKFLKSIENIAKAKCELIPYTKENIIINKDCDLLVKTAKEYKKKLLYFSLLNEADVYVKKIISEKTNSSSFVINDKIHDDDVEINLPLPGRHNMTNFLPSYILARFLGLSVSEIIKGVSNIKQIKGRYNVVIKNNITIIDDCYNANPESMISGITGFSNSHSGKKIALLGDMMELGENEEKLHFEVGMALAELKIDKLITVGELARQIAYGASKKGFKNYKSFLNIKDAARYLNDTLARGDHLFVKASNSTGLNKIYDQLNLFKE